MDDKQQFPRCEELIEWENHTKMKLCGEPAQYSTCSVIGGVVCEDHKCRCSFEFDREELNKFIKEQKQPKELK